MKKETKIAIIGLGYVGLPLEFVNYTTADFKQLSKGKLVLLDIKGIYNESSWKF